MDNKYLEKIANAYKRAISKGLITGGGKLKTVKGLPGLHLHDAKGGASSAAIMNQKFNGGVKPVANTVLSPTTRINPTPQKGALGKILDKIRGTTPNRQTTIIPNPARNTTSMDSLAGSTLNDRRAPFKARVQSGEIYQDHGAIVTKKGISTREGPKGGPLPRTSKLPTPAPAVAPVVQTPESNGILDKAKEYAMANKVKIGAGVLGVGGIGYGAHRLMSDNQEQKYTYG